MEKGARYHFWENITRIFTVDKDSNKEYVYTLSTYLVWICLHLIERQGFEKSQKTSLLDLFCFD